ncbi:hypothetical protein C447_07738 [Halococcus hamelinensis 100A6]|uniref:DUF8106 domain-containing protein n=1 Tax=Halococcus hamelinensis 100A6 TaxID=1132509 RepID=M0M048_9EURY|nr:hypothetical protein C447_07738 [Halococcus hamelinensis 100A6]
MDRTNPRPDGGSGCAGAERASQRRKSVLVCPGCGREALATGDWDRESTDRESRIDLVCPECRTRLATRRSDPGTEHGRETPAPMLPGTTFPHLAVSTGLHVTAMQLDLWTRLWAPSTARHGRGRS